MKRILPLLAFCILSPIVAFAQTENSIENSYTEFFKLPRETIFLHLNKTTFLAGEEVWFKGYAYDQKNKLTSKATTNITVGIYDADGKEVKRALFKGENGFAKGNLPIDSTFVTGTYYVKAATNWMKNFNDEGAFLQKIQVFSDKIAGNSKDPEVAVKAYDFQFLPEGGHIVANTSNTVGFKIINANGKGVAVTGNVYDARDELVTQFKSNTLGLGKFLFQPKPNEVYTSKITLPNGEVITEKLPAIKSEGISIVMNNMLPDKTIITLNTNAKTLPKIASKPYKLLIHQSGKLKTVTFAFEDNPSKTITIPKTELFKGINILTLFNAAEQPVLERVFFNTFDMKTGDITVTKRAVKNDSIYFDVKEFNLNEEANLSISILPEATESYNPKYNIISKFLLEPYIKGSIENPAYYFTKLDRKRQYELDILLVTQGWSKYDWNQIFNNPPKQYNVFENGITIKGKVNSPSSGVDRLFMYSTKNHKAQFIELSEDQSFTISNFYLEEGEKVRFSYQDRRGILKKPGLFVTFIVTDKEDDIAEVIDEMPLYDTNASAPSFDLSKNFFSDDSVELDAIVLQTKKKGREDLDTVLINAKAVEVDVKTYAQFPFVADYIQNNGYRVIENQGDMSITTRNRLSIASAVSPLVFLDDVPLTNFNILSGFSMGNVERIIIDKSGFGYGVRGAGGVIKIYTRVTALYDDQDTDATISNINIAPYAFTAAKEYYAPKYSSYGNSYFEKYGVVSWIPEVVLEKNQAASFKIYNSRTKKAVLYIEGVTATGNLISQQQIIDLRN